MITVFFHVSVWPGKESEFQALAREMTETSRKDDGCLDYIFYANTADPASYVLYERWRDQEALTAHLARLVAELGPPDDDPALPATHLRRRLPRAFMDLLASAQATRYEPLLQEDVATQEVNP